MKGFFLLQRNGIFILSEMTLEEEKNYWKDLVKDLTDNMDRNAISYYKWKKCSESLFKALSQYHDYHGLPKDTILYRQGLDALVEYEKLNNEIISLHTTN
jgi:hypothetical protein